MSHFTADIQTLRPDHSLRYRLLDGGQALPYSQVLELWRDDKGFRQFFIGLLADAPFEGYFWETPPVNSRTLERPFEFVLIDGPGFRRMRPSKRAFAQYFSRPTDYEGVVSFPNLRRDALLVVPCPISDDSAYPHLAAFIRQAPEEQVHALWQLAGEAMRQRISKQNTWLSTHGFGVYWLHLRLDSIPKYYHHAEYRNM